MLILLIAIASFGLFVLIANLIPAAGNVVVALLKYVVGPLALILLIMGFIVRLVRGGF